MTDYRKINNLVGWVVFLIATVMYVLTLEPTASFWDAGEFIASSYKLLVPHPPGAPFYLLVGRLFSMFASEPSQVAWWVNLLSALWHRVTRDEVDEATLHKIAAILDEAAQKIERLTGKEKDEDDADEAEA